ncbi:MAG: tRNA preQ1(34) S-adenosylmethionine ribosyltransferase-isomerase QueA, partial [Abitibacteriaceae bacterium]|nr:tRNA preQ1(34) S-adenosylmethionine ribosyltransferase-isomerase QueA [Abditibacteriaceae bacterium]
MLTADLDYHLPPELIAQQPAEPRDHSRLMHLQRATGALQHLRFDALPDLLRVGDLLVFNDTRVLRARLHGHKEIGGGHVEALLLREVKTNFWEALLKPSARLRPGATVIFSSPTADVTAPAQLIERTAIGWLLRFFSEGTKRNIRELLPQLGEVPLPPYIKQPPREEAQYQTVYARMQAGNTTGVALDSAAAPTAGLHFTPRILEALHARGIRTAFVTLGVGVGTFRPVQTDTLEEHSMHAEEFEVPAATAAAIQTQRERGGRVVAVGTTTTRVLESVATADGGVPAGFGSTRIFIRPGYQFRCVDALLTNFHLPRSTLLAMIAAFAENRPHLPINQESLSATEDQLTGLEKIRYAYSRA